MAWGFVIGVLTLPYQWFVMLRDKWRQRKSSTGERKRERAHP